MFYSTRGGPLIDSNRISCGIAVGRTQQGWKRLQMLKDLTRGGIYEDRKRLAEDSKMDTKLADLVNSGIIIVLA